VPSLRGTCARSRMGIQLFFPITLRAPCTPPPGWKQPEYTLTHLLLLRCSLDSTRSLAFRHVLLCCAFVIPSWDTIHLLYMLHSRWKKTKHCTFSWQGYWGILIIGIYEFLAEKWVCAKNLFYLISVTKRNKYHSFFINLANQKASHLLYSIRRYFKVGY